MSLQRLGTIYMTRYRGNGRATKKILTWQRLESSYMIDLGSDFASGGRTNWHSATPPHTSRRIRQSQAFEIIVSTKHSFFTLRLGKHNTVHVWHTRVDISVAKISLECDENHWISFTTDRQNLGSRGQHDNESSGRFGSDQVGISSGEDCRLLFGSGELRCWLSCSNSESQGNFGKFGSQENFGYVQGMVKIVWAICGSTNSTHHIPAKAE